MSDKTNESRDDSAPQSLRFLKNEEGNREAHEFSSPERSSQEGQQIRERGIVLVGHIDHGKTMIIEALLKTHDFSGEVILIEGDCKYQERIGLAMGHPLANPIEELINTQMLITARQIDDLGDIMLDLTTDKRIHNKIYYTPKTQKSKAKTHKRQDQKKK